MSLLSQSELTLVVINTIVLPTNTLLNSPYHLLIQHGGRTRGVDEICGIQHAKIKLLVD